MKKVKQDHQSGKKHLLKIDLTKGYFQITVTPEDVRKTAFVTTDGEYQFLQTPFGMMNSGTTLVRGLKKFLEGLFRVGSYIDHIVVCNGRWEEHFRMLKELFIRLRKARITAQEVLTRSQQDLVSRPQDWR